MTRVQIRDAALDGRQHVVLVANEVAQGLVGQCPERPTRALRKFAQLLVDIVIELHAFGSQDYSRTCEATARDPHTALDDVAMSQPRSLRSQSPALATTPSP